MTIKSRIILLAFQIVILTITTFLVTDKIAINEIWYFSGLLAIVINPLLLEPWYPKTYDTLANSIIALILTYVVNVNTAIIGWNVLRVFLILLLILSVFRLIYNSKKDRTKGAKINATFPLFKLGKAVIIYSVVFWLAVIELYPPSDNKFWILAICWTILSISRYINWELFFLELSDKPTPILPIGIIGPSTLIVTSKNLLNPGTNINVVTGKIKVKGYITKKINRTDDTWGQIHLKDDSKIGWLVTRPHLIIEKDTSEDSKQFLGSINEGTNTNQLVFDTNERIEIGNTIYLNNLGETVLYQVVSAEVYKLIVKSGAQFDRKIKAFQIGTYDLENQSLRLNKSLPNLNESIYLANAETRFTTDFPAIGNKFSLGDIKDSSFPINIDIEKLKESHLAMLGMTGMGKTTLCHLLIQELAKTRRITVMDQSGEFVSKLNYAPYADGDDLNTNGVSVCEPTGNSAQSALKYLNHLMSLAKNEYKQGNHRPRVLVLDEAHQFIPEPAGMSFNTPGRDESTQFGMNMMQVRKYGISIIFISQRTAVVSKSALSQCENLIAFKNVDQTGLDYLEGILGFGTKSLLPTLCRGEALVYGPAIDVEKSVVIDTRKE